MFIGELVRYSRGCTYYKEFEDRAAGSITKLPFLSSYMIDSHIVLAQKSGVRVLSLVDRIHS